MISQIEKNKIQNLLHTKLMTFPLDGNILIVFLLDFQFFFEEELLQNKVITGGKEKMMVLTCFGLYYFNLDHINTEVYFKLK